MFLRIGSSGGLLARIKKPGCHYPAFQKGEKESVNLPIDASIISSLYVNKLDAYTMAACC
jgi:hypothetical protein